MTDPLGFQESYVSEGIPPLSGDLSEMLFGKHMKQ